MAKLGDLLRTILEKKLTSGEEVDQLVRDSNFLQLNTSGLTSLLRGNEIILPLLIRDRMESTVFNASQGWQIKGDGTATFRGVTISGGSLRITSGGALKIDLQTDGDAFFGSDLAAAGTTAFSVFSNAQTYNGESMGAGDMLLGDNSSGKPNVLWDVSAGKLFVRTGTTVAGEITGGTFKQYGAWVACSTQTITNNTSTLIVPDLEVADDASFYNPTVNYVKNPSFEVNVTDDWTRSSAVVGTLAQTTDWAVYGTGAAKYTCGASFHYIESTAGVSVPNGATVSIRGSMRANTAPTAGKMYVICRDTTNGANRV
ncbi:MAG: hypothetical protein LUO93_11135, partial [Methanomicrobiales archaeon]|nr:hypothetical protein [Methanomicrobiales archaeon]